MLFHRIALCMTRRCNAACGICCFSCSPDSSERIGHEALRFHIRDAASHPQITRVGFTGGEALLDYEEVLELSRYARALGLTTSVNTNGFWGEDPERWRPQLCALREAGLECVYFSADPWHQQFVPVAQLRRAIELTLSLGQGFTTLAASIFLNWGKSAPNFTVQNSWISSSLPGAWLANWLQGKSRISKPFSCSSLYMASRGS